MLHNIYIHNNGILIITKQIVLRSTYLSYVEILNVHTYTASPILYVGDCNSPHQVSGIQSSTSLPEGEDKQHCNMNNADDNDVFDDGNTPEAESKRNESSMPNGNNEETNILSEVDNEAQEESQTGIVK